MSRHIGVVGVTWPGALLCVQAICEEGAALRGADRYPEISLHCFPGEDYITRIARGDWPGVADLMVEAATRLADGGADFAISPANTAHEVFDVVAERSPIPWISIVEATADEAVSRGFTRLGVLGTRPLVERRFYRQVFEKRGVAVEMPPPDASAEMHRLIVEELVRNAFTDQSRAFFRDTARALRDRGCDAVIMGCTEIPLILSPEDIDIPLLDSTRLLARAAVAEAWR